MNIVAELAKGSLASVLKYCLGLLGQPPSDEEKVKAIQHILGTAEDGDPGPRTRAELFRLIPPVAERI